MKASKEIFKKRRIKRINPSKCQQKLVFLEQKCNEKYSKTKVSLCRKWGFIITLPSKSLQQYSYAIWILSISLMILK